MIFRITNLPSAFALTIATGCYTGSAVDTNRGPSHQGLATDGTEPNDDPAKNDAGTSSGVVGTSSGIPCDVEALLTLSCSGCHGTILAGGAPSKLLSYEDLSAPSASEPTVTIAALSLRRMKAATQPMPPDQTLTLDFVRIFERWVEGGLRRSECRRGAP